MFQIIYKYLAVTRVDFTYKNLQLQYIRPSYLFLWLYCLFDFSFELVCFHPFWSDSLNDDFDLPSNDDPIFFSLYEEKNKNKLVWTVIDSWLQRWCKNLVTF